MLQTKVALRPRQWPVSHSPQQGGESQCHVLRAGELEQAPAPAKQTPLEEVAGAPQYHSVAEQSLSLQKAVHYILATALAKQSPL